MFRTLARCATVLLALSIPQWPMAARAETGWFAKGPTKVQVQDAVWTDTARSARQVPVRIHLPDGRGRHPVILFSHGLGGSREAADYLGQHWASHGFISIHLQHPGSDESIWRSGGRPREQFRRAATPEQLAARVADVAFALDELARLDRGPGPLAGRLDLDRVGMAGHSMGSITTLLAVGQTPPNGTIRPEPRIRAAVALSPSPPRSGDPQRMFQGVRVPVLHITGTEDTLRFQDFGPAEREIPFRSITAPGQILLVFDGADHMVFSGRTNAGRSRGDRDRALDAHVQASVQAATTSFWAAQLKGDGQALDWLRDGGLRRGLRPGDRMLVK